MTDRRLYLALAPLALLSACGESADEGPAATGEVLEGTISDAMLPVDQVRSEPPLEDPEAFAEANSEGEGEDGAEAPTDADGGTTDAAEDPADDAPVPEATPEAAD